jgi:hypothetical protein
MTAFLGILETVWWGVQKIRLWMTSVRWWWLASEVVVGMGREFQVRGRGELASPPFFVFGSGAPVQYVFLFCVGDDGEGRPGRRREDGGFAAKALA